MGTKVWNFLLPNSGTHQLRVEEIGTPGQIVFINGDRQSLGEARVFTGPENSLLELKCQGQQWSLCVNGYHVEDYNVDRRRSGDETLRELRSKPEGSYLISTNFEATDLALNIIRKFQFKVHGQVHEVQIAHSDCIWQVIVDGSLVDRVSHTLKDNSGEAKFEFQVEAGQKIKATCCMEWLKNAMIWHYVLVVNGVDIPVCWTKAGGEMAVGEMYEVMATPCNEALAANPLVGQEEVLKQGDIASPEDLPQGVSFDRMSGTYQANIRAKTGKFVFLGEFGTPEAAHQRYLEAVPIHCPDKHIAPDLLT